MSSLDNEKRECCPDTFTSRPRELTVVGCGDFCTIALCKSSTCDRDRNKSGIGFFSFPSDPTIRKQWVKVISHLLFLKFSSDSFSIKKSTKVWEFHFPVNCIRISCGYEFKQEPPKKKRKSPKKLYFEPLTVTESDSFTDASSDSDCHSDHSGKCLLCRTWHIILW